MEITTVFYGNEIDKDVREKYNMIYVQDFSCKINNSEITIAVNKVQPKEVYGDDGKMLGTAQRAFMDSMYDIKIMRGKAVIATVENFGSSMAPQGAGDSYYMAFIPQVISYDGYNVYYCRYFKAEHQCNFIRTDYKLLELKKNLQTKSVN